MKTRFRLVFAFVALLGFTAAWAQPSPLAPKPGYNVTLEISYDEKGEPEDATVVASEDPTGDRMLEQIAMNMARQDKQPPRVIDGKAVKFKARRPFNFPVEGDGGPAANASRPTLRAGKQATPHYPEALGEKEVNGGAILQLVLGADGTVKSVRTLRASHPEFARAAEEAVKQWTFVPREGAPAEARWNVAMGFTANDENVDLKWRLAPRPSLGGFIAVRPSADALKAAAAAANAAPAPAPVTPEQKK